MPICLTDSSLAGDPMEECPKGCCGVVYEPMFCKEPPCYVTPPTCEVQGTKYSTGQVTLDDGSCLNYVRNTVYNDLVATSAAGKLEGAGFGDETVGTIIELGQVCVTRRNPRGFPGRYTEYTGPDQSCPGGVYTMAVVTTCSGGELEDCGIWNEEEFERINSPVCSGKC